MRTTVTLDPDVDALLKRYMRERGLSFKEAINQAIRQGIAGNRAIPGERMRTFKMGVPKVNLDKALQLAGELENQEIIRQMREREAEVRARPDGAS